MQHLLSAWPEVVARLREASHILLLADFDGTLAPIAHHPGLALLPRRTKTALEKVARLDRITLGIISGRGLADLKDKVPIEGIIYAGNHGLEIEGPGLSFVEPHAARSRPIMHRLYEELSQSLGEISGIVIEDKSLSLSVHYRLSMESDYNEIEGIVRQVAAPAEAAGTAIITTGKKIFEIRPAVSWGKGEAIKLIMKIIGNGRQVRLLPIYLGDDLTDEDGFKAVNERESSLSVLVGKASHESGARFCLDSPAEAVTFVKRLMVLRSNKL